MKNDCRMEVCNESKGDFSNRSIGKVDGCQKSCDNRSDNRLYHYGSNKLIVKRVSKRLPCGYFFLLWYTIRKEKE